MLRNFRLSPSIASFALLISSTAGAAAEQLPSMLGFTPEHAQAQAALEQKFDAALSADHQREWLRQMSSEPNHVGSPHDKANADFMLAKFKEWGWDAHIETFYVLYPTLKSHTLELIAPNKFTAALKEPPIDGDSTSANTAGALPPYNAYGGDGDVTADLVYVNFGMPDDYLELARNGVDVKGKIVIARYGRGWRGLKPKLAYEHGAVGCIIYSDPHDDGYSTGDAYPKGGTRPADGVQRGSVEDMTLYPGDPLTPGVGATKDAKRLALKDAKVVLKIPVLPISYADAQPLLAALGGQVVSPAWRGGLPITYHFGPGPAKVHLAIASDWLQKPVYDVIAMLRGSKYPDQWIVRGNHHDGWVFGAWDPLAGNVALMNEAEAIGSLLKTGWKPARTLVYASWDGEEPGLLGSTEWAETHADELKHKAVLYLNSDTNSRGFLSAGGSHSFERLVNQVANDVRDPQTGVSVQARLRASIEVDGAAQGAGGDERAAAKLVKGDGDIPIDGLGSGSDYSSFLQHLGVAAVDIGFSGEDQQGGVYHSIYDSFDHYVRFGDPKFAYGVALSQVGGRIVLRTADADVLPMRASNFADTVSRYADQVHELAGDERERAELVNRLRDGNLYKLAADPTETRLPPVAEPPVPFIDFAPLDNALVNLKHSATEFDKALAERTARATDANAAQLQKANVLLQSLEQTLTASAGLPGREWYVHMIYAPGKYTGYGVKTLPGLREALEQKEWKTADKYSAVIATALDSYSARLDQATAALAVK